MLYSLCVILKGIKYKGYKKLLPYCVPFLLEERGNRTKNFDTAIGYSCDLELPKMALPPKPPCHETEEFHTNNEEGWSRVRSFVKSENQS